MARTDTLGNFLTDIADAIREKKGTTDTIQASNFDTEIANLPSGGEGNTFTFVETPTNVLPCKNINIVVTENVPDYGFYNNIMLNNITIEEGITTIGNSAFAMRTTGDISGYITKLPSTLTSVGEDAFHRNINLTITSIPSGVTEIKEGAFSYCVNITELEILGNITNIDRNAFRGDTSLAKVSFPNITSVPTMTSYNAFMGTLIESGTGYIYVPDNLVDAVKTASQWSTYANQIKPISELEAS